MNKTSQSFNAYTLIILKLHKALIIMNRIIRVIRNNITNQQITRINKNISQINELTEIDIMPIDTSDFINNHSIAIQNFEIYRKSLYTARQIENNNMLRDKI